MTAQVRIPCRAKDPRTCAYHGAQNRAEKALRAGNMDAYFEAQQDLAAAIKTEPEVAEFFRDAYTDAELSSVFVRPDDSDDWEFELVGVSRAEWAAITVVPFEKNFRYEPFSSYVDYVTYESGGYGPPAGYSAEQDPYDDGYGRNNIFYGLKIDPDIKTEEVAEGMYHPRTVLARRVAEAYVRANGLDQPSAYDVEAQSGYYGQEAYLTISLDAVRKSDAFRDLFKKS